MTDDRQMPSREFLTAVLRVSQERMHTLKDVYQAGPYFFTEPDYAKVNSTKFRKKHSPETIGRPFLHHTNGRQSTDRDKRKTREITRLGS